jgi:hypothetical protein
MNLNINFTPFTVIWVLLALVVLALIGYRRLVAAKEDETLHLAAGPSVSDQQVVVAHKLDVIDKWGKLLTVVALVYGLLLAGAYTWQTWLSSNTPTGL